MSLDSIVNVVITTATKTPSQRGFGTPMSVSYHTAWPDRSREYSNASELLDDGFTVNSKAYKDALAFKGQNPCPRTFKIGKRTSAPDRTVQIVPTETTEGYVYGFNVVNAAGLSTAISYTVPALATTAVVVTGLQALINAISGIDAADDTTHVTVTATTPGDFFQITDVDHGEIELKDTTADPGLAADLAAIWAEDGDAYSFCIDSCGDAENKAAAAFAEARRILFVSDSVDAEILDPGVTDDTFSDLAASSYARTIPLFSEDFGMSGPAAWLGNVLPFLPGSQTWAYKTLAGHPTSDLSDAEEAAVLAKNGNFYTDLGSNGATQNGQSAAGEFADVTRGVDWLYARIQEAVIALLLNNRKIPYTNAGAQIVRGAVFQVLQQGVKNGFLAAEPAPTVTVPNVNDVSATDRANRHLPDVEFTARLAGAIHTLDISGVVSA